MEYSSCACRYSSPLFIEQSTDPHAFTPSWLPRLFAMPYNVKWKTSETFESDKNGTWNFDTISNNQALSKGSWLLRQARMEQISATCPRIHQIFSRFDKGSCLWNFQSLQPAELFFLCKIRQASSHIADLRVAFRTQTWFWVSPFAGKLDWTNKFLKAPPSSLLKPCMSGKHKQIQIERFLKFSHSFSWNHGDIIGSQRTKVINQNMFVKAVNAIGQQRHMPSAGGVKTPEVTVHESKRERSGSTEWQALSKAKLQPGLQKLTKSRCLARRKHLQYVLFQKLAVWLALPGFLLWPCFVAVAVAAAAVVVAVVVVVVVVAAAVAVAVVVVVVACDLCHKMDVDVQFRAQGTEVLSRLSTSLPPGTYWRKFWQSMEDDQHHCMVISAWTKTFWRRNINS